MKKKRMKKLRKEAIKDICNNTFVIGKFRDIFGMYDYDKEEVAKVMKVMIKDFLKNGYDDPEKLDLLELARSRGREDIVYAIKAGDYEDDDDDEDNEYDEYADAKTVVPRVNRKSSRSKLDRFF